MNNIDGGAGSIPVESGKIIIMINNCRKRTVY